MSTRRMIDWRIEPGASDDSYTLYRRNREVMSDRGMPDVMKYVRRYRSPGETLHQLDEQGSSKDLTRMIDPAPPTANPRRIRLNILPLRRR